MAEIKILDLRVSLIWVETVLDLLSDSVPSDAALACLGRSWSYAGEFDELKSTGSGPMDLELPWRKTGVHWFWTHYLEGHTRSEVTGSRAWKAQIPFRGKVPAQVEAPWLRGHLVLESFFYPHGVALVLTARCATPMTFDQAVGTAFEIRRQGRYSIQWEEWGRVESLKADRVARKVLWALRTTAMGGGATVAARSVEPFSVVTVVRGTGVSPGIPTPEGGEAHRAMEAVTCWRPTWQHDSLPALADASLPTRTVPPSHILYGRKRGRAVWFPALFMLPPGQLRTLACYHRNLVLASLQVESLSLLVSSTAKELRAGRLLSAAHSDCARRAAGVLGRLYGATPDIYRSWSPRVHIEQNNLVSTIDAVRDHFGMPPLH